MTSINIETEIEVYSGLNEEGTLDVHIVHDAEENQDSIFYFIESMKDEENAFFWSYSADKNETTLEELIDEARGLILDRATSEQMAKMSPAALARLKANQAKVA
ncbi:hypothetical protein [Neisseria iguanae]|uniref:Uncharacterized protein n=1 Tax=Neisseria iguanae TaxID=90242 RepID=A0A2P7U2C4_9NEIS|nr:hypothetical protein [Neisseria iguanae]PSJ81134.1 hypothetical protein C7N83_02065 [Neisseria iguanae]